MTLRLAFFLLLPASLPAGSFTLDAIPSRVRAAHPSLQAARLALDEARGRQLGAGRLPNPTAGFEFQPESSLSPRTATFSLDQNFPLTRRLSLEKERSARLITAAEWEVKEVERRLIAEAASLAVEVMAIGQHLALHQQQAKLAATLVEFTEARARVGEISHLDASQAKVDARRLELESRQLAARKTLLLGQLKPLLGLPVSAELALAGELPPPALPAAGDWQQRPDYQLALLREQTAHTDTALANAGRWQDISAGLFAASEKQQVGGGRDENTGFVGFRIGIPLPLWDRNQGRVAEAAAAAQRARQETAALAAEIAHEAETARRDMADQMALFGETRDRLLPLLAEQAAAVEKAYEAGQTDLLTLLRTREQHLEARSSLIDTLRDFHLARVRHQTAIGTLQP